jgi:DHA1 family bicyclomycin/chloramphenicol resistance-like MFS transporter
VPASSEALRGGLTERQLIVLIGCLLMLQPLATDLYLVSLPGLTRTFATTVPVVQLTLSLFVAAFAVMQLWSGPLADRFGRRPVVIGGIALYCGASLFCVIAPGIGWLIAGRVLQAIGCCTAAVVARAIVRDVFDLGSGARVMASASALLSLGPILGPILGAALETRFAHRGAFVALAAFSGALLWATIAKLHETNLHRDPTATDARALARNYRDVLRSREFLAYAAIGTLSYGGLFAFLAGCSFVLIRVLGLPVAWFGVAYALDVSGYLVGTLVARSLLPRRGLPATLRVGAWFALAAGLSYATLALVGVHHWLAILASQFVYFFAHGILFPGAMAGVVHPFPRHAGAAAGMFGFISMLIAALVGTWIGFSDNGTVYPLVLTIAAFAFAVFAVVLTTTTRQRHVS